MSEDRLQRPSHKELKRKIETARRLLALGRWGAAENEKLWANFAELDLTLAEEQECALRAAFAELRPEFYYGTRPPTRSYEPAARDAEMFAFVWQSKHFGKAMYCKWAIVGSRRTARLVLFSLHPSRRGRTRA